MLSTFEFWLELNWCNSKTFMGFVNKLFVLVQYKADSKQNIVFSVAFLISWMDAKIQISLHHQILTRFHQVLFKFFGLYEQMKTQNEVAGLVGLGHAGLESILLSGTASKFSCKITKKLNIFLPYSSDVSWQSVITFMSNVRNLIKNNL